MPTTAPTIRPTRCDAEDLRRWSARGLRWLTGPADGDGLGPPQGFVAHVDELERRIAEASATVGRPVELDGLGVLAARAAIGGLSRQGSVSCGGATHLVEAGDGWLALSLARPDDIELVPAWLEAPEATGPAEANWNLVHERCATRPVVELVERGALLGLPIAALGETAATRRPAAVRSEVGTSTRRPASHRIRVADLSSLWAGPLCGAILAAAGAEVIKVESTSRPDGARLGPPEFFELLNGAKEHRSVDLTTTGGIEALRALLASVDVVIEASRPRALAQLGIDAVALLSAEDGPSVWVSITGHGRDGDAATRVAFGDDAAVAGGLVAWDGDGDSPSFCSDAIADPLSGMTAAAEALDALSSGQRVLVDVAMASVAAHAAGPTCAVGPEPVQAPAAGPITR